jgi:TonB family protein
MHPFRTIACALLLLALPWSSQAQNVRWYEVSSENFILFTDTSEAKGRRLVTDLESRLTSFETAFGVVPKRQFPIEILLYRHVADFLESAPAVVPPDVAIDEYNSAYMLKGPDRTFIVAQDKSPDDIANEVGHQLGHMFLDRIVLWHPFWLEEAAAEYFRMVGRNPDTKRIEREDRLQAGDILEIVPSATYNDRDPAGPFRIQSYRLLRIVMQDRAAELRSYISALKLESGRDARLSLDAQKATERLSPFTDTRIAPGSVPSNIQSREVLAADVSVHRGDALVAARRNLLAARWYEGNSADARAARVIFGKMTSGSESLPQLERAVVDFPDRGLVQYHFGSIETQDARLVTKQIEALELAVKLLPRMGRAHAELARVLTIGFQPEEALSLLDRAVALEPEYADRFYILRAEALVALRRFDEASKAAKLALALPHVDRAATTTFNQRVMLLDQRIQEIQMASERLQVEQLRESIAAEATRREPVRPPPPPPEPFRAGQINYQYEATNAVEILKSVLPDYADPLVKVGKAGKITLQVNIGVDGLVSNATITESQIPEMNAATVAAVKKWTFKPLLRAGRPAAFNIKLVMQFSIQ